MVYCCSHQSRCLLYIIWDNRTAICLERGFLHVPVRRSFFFSIFSGAGKFCLAHGLRQLTRDIKSDVRILNFRSDLSYSFPQKSPNDVHKRSLCDVKCQK